MTKALSLEGTRFGKLVVTNRAASSRDGSVLWNCICDCGNVFQATSRHLNRKKNVVRSCGCNKIKRGSAHAQWSGFNEISGHWWSSHVKHSGNSKGRISIEVTLTKEEAWEVFLKQERKCVFSGEVLIISNSPGLNTASIDRIDNTVGYTKENIQWTHKAINMMKRIYSSEEFIKWCNKVTAHSGVCPVR